VTVAIAAPHPAAIEAAGVAVAAGGGAIDAAIAGAAALAVAYPHQCSVGGDLVALVRPPGGSPRAVLSVGAAPAGIPALTGDPMPWAGPLTITVPGVVAGWAAVAGLGARLPLSELLAPAVGLAGEGVPVSAGLHRAIVGHLDVVRADQGLAALLLDSGGAPLPVGAPLVQSALASTLTTLGADWSSFYRGDLAERLATGLERLGSPISIADLAAHHAEILDPLQTVVDGVTWHVAPPPTQGVTLLGLLGSSDLLTDAREAQLRRDALLGDPRGGPIDVDALRLLGPGPAPDAPSAPKPRGDTVAVTAVAEDGTAVTLIQSIFQSFGSGLLEPATGIVLHNRGAAFSLDPTHPGRLAPGVRPPHTLCPTLATNDDTVVALGCQGGRSQAWILAQVAGAVLDADDLGAVLARPRWVIGARDLGRANPSLVLEPGTSGAESLSATADGLGLEVATTEGLHDDAGHVQVARVRGGLVGAASDIRADGLGAVLDA
jgi:gamma-glutamyltranspeptidase